MTNWPIGLSTGCFYQKNILECLDPIRAAGFSMVEVCSFPAHLDYHDLEAVRHVRIRMQDLGIEAYSFHAPFADAIDISALEAVRREEALSEILRAAEAAAALHVHYLVIHPGPENAHIPPERERLQRMENVIGVLNRVVRHCAQLGIVCLLENKLPHLLFGKTNDILWIFNALDSADVGACLDTGHALLSDDLHNLVRKLNGHIRMIHVHDNWRQSDDHLPPGDGAIEWKPLLQEWIDVRFHGSLILEIASTPSVEQTLANAVRGRAFLRKISRELIMPRPL